MTTVNREQVLEALHRVYFPGSGHNNRDAAGECLQAFTVEGDILKLVLNLPDAVSPKDAARFEKQCMKALKKLPGIKQVMVAMTAVRPVSGAPSSFQQASHGLPAQRPLPPSPKPIPGVKHAIAVAAGKGGVGKSTVAVNLAVSLAKLGYKTGLVDADIYGPSVARMMRLSEKPDTAEGKMIPPERYGVKCMSMGFLLGEDAPAVWRGPMATKALAQLVVGATWGELDYLIFDLPPGTGDIHLTLVQNFTLDGAVMVATPQEVALLDVRKAIGMFGKVGVKVLGIVENMSYFIDPVSGTKTYIFGQGGVRKLAEELKLDIISEIPMEPLIASTSDAGTPMAASHPEHAVAQAYAEIARKVAERVGLSS